MTRIKAVALDQATVSFALAVVIFIVALIGRLQLWMAALLAGVLVLSGLILLVFRRFAAVEVLATPTRDERTFMIHTKASAVAGNAVAVLAIVAFLWSLAHGDTSVTPWVTVGAVFGLAYLAASVFFLWRE